MSAEKKPTAELERVVQETNFLPVSHWSWSFWHHLSIHHSKFPMIYMIYIDIKVLNIHQSLITILFFWWCSQANRSPWGSFWSRSHVTIMPLKIITVSRSSLTQQNRIFFKHWSWNNPCRTWRFFFVVSLARLEWPNLYPHRPCLDSCCLWKRLFIWQSRTSRFQVPSFGEWTMQIIHRCEPNREVIHSVLEDKSR